MSDEQIKTINRSIRIGAVAASVGAGLCSGFASKDYFIAGSAAMSAFGIVIVFNNAARAVSWRLERSIERNYNANYRSKDSKLDHS